MPMNSHREFNGKHCGKKIPYNSMTSHVTKCIGEKTQKVIWKFMWLTKIVQLCATAVTKPWKMQFFFGQTNGFSLQCSNAICENLWRPHSTFSVSPRSHSVQKDTHVSQEIESNPQNRTTESNAAKMILMIKKW